MFCSYFYPHLQSFAFSIFRSRFCKHVSMCMHIYVRSQKGKCSQSFTDSTVLQLCADCLLVLVLLNNTNLEYDHVIFLFLLFFFIALHSTHLEQVTLVQFSVVVIFLIFLHFPSSFVYAHLSFGHINRHKIFSRCRFQYKFEHSIQFNSIIFYFILFFTLFNKTHNVCH